MIELSQIIPHIFLFTALYFQIFLLITFFENRENLRGEAVRKNLNYPSVTVIVPCYNEEETVVGTVRSLLELTYPPEKLNVFVVDDGSTDNTRNAMRIFEGNSRVTLLQKENGGKHTALNLGISRTRDELVGCLDADSFVAPNALLEIVKYFEHKDVMAVTPAVKVHNASTILEHIQQAEYNMGIFLSKMFGTMNAIQVTPGPFSLFRKKVFEELGGFKEAHNTEDMEIALRMQSKHYRIENAHTAHVFTVAPKTVRGLYKQRVRWIYGFLKNILDYRFMLLNKEYGHLGLLTLPFAIISIASAIYMAGYIITRTINFIAEKVLQIQTVGLEWKGFHVDWFFLNTQSLAILTTFTLFVTLFIVFGGKKLSEGNVRPSKDIFYFLIFYGLIAPIWLTKAVYNVILSKKSSWR